jgi:hypothetical protein
MRSTGLERAVATDGVTASWLVRIIEHVVARIIFWVTPMLLNPLPSTGLPLKYFVFSHLRRENLKLSQSFGTA